MASWREKALEIIREAVKDKPREEWEKVIRDAYPWHPRKHWPYQSWLAARREVLGLTKPEVIPEPVPPDGQGRLV
jgi:hypothetical protein